VRVALLSALLAFTACLTVMGFIYWRTGHDEAGALRRHVTEEAAVLNDVYLSAGRPALRRAIADTLGANDPEYLAATLDGQGRGRTGNVEALVGPGQPLAPGYHTGWVRVRGHRVPLDAGYLLRPLDKGDWLVSGRGYGERDSLQRTLERSILVSIILSVLLGLLCGILIARYVGRRVEAIAEVADRVTGGDLDQRVPIAGTGDAFDALGRRINHMLDRIGTLMGELRMVTDALAHDLRSPVGRLRARVDAALRAPRQERETLLAGVIQEADALMRILGTVLEIGRSEAMASRKQFAPLDAAGLVAELAEMYEPLAEDAGVALRVEAATPRLRLVGHRQLLAQALSNLVDNALAYGASGGEILLFARERQGRVEVGVADKGPGIPPEDRDEARRRFGRLDSSRSRAGAGLGLALAEAVAHLHEGTLQLDDNQPGLRATLVLKPDAAR
jgi:signal transduction histidine kinase